MAEFRSMELIGELRYRASRLRCDLIQYHQRTQQKLDHLRQSEDRLLAQHEAQRSRLAEEQESFQAQLTDSREQLSRLKEKKAEMEQRMDRLTRSIMSTREQLPALEQQLDLLEDVCAQQQTIRDLLFDRHSMQDPRLEGQFHSLLRSLHQKTEQLRSQIEDLQQQQIMLECDRRNCLQERDSIEVECGRLSQLQEALAQRIRNAPLHEYQSALQMTQAQMDKIRHMQMDTHRTLEITEMAVRRVESLMDSADSLANTANRRQRLEQLAQLEAEYHNMTRMLRVMAEESEAVFHREELSDFHNRIQMLSDHFHHFCTVEAGKYMDAPQCFPPVAPPPAKPLDEVQFRCAAPMVLRPGKYFTAKIMMFREDDTARADREAKLIDDKVRAASSDVIDAEKGQEFTIGLQSPDLPELDEVQTIRWNGKYAARDFQILLPGDYGKDQLRLLGRIYAGHAPMTDISLILEVSSPAPQALVCEKVKLRTAFVSYSSKDRAEVVKRIQGMEAARDDMDIFLDVESLRRGEEYEPRLYQEIRERDLFYLFWSRNAAASEWVGKELAYAVEHKDMTRIEPIALEDPDICPPPEALNKRHFRDWTLKYIS